MSDVKLGLEAWEELPEEKKSILEQLGGGYRPPPAEPIPPQKEEPPKRYPYPMPDDAWAKCAECGSIILADTAFWPEPLCPTHYSDACARPPRAVLSFDDGHREMRRNVIASKVYRDVVHTDDDALVRWFEFVSEQRENGKLVMQFYRQIPRPVDALGKPLALGHAYSMTTEWMKPAEIQHLARHRPWWKRLVVWFRVAWALKRLP